MFCPNCGSNNTEDAKFCTGCGAPLSNEVKEENANTVTQVEGQPVQPEMQSIQPEMQQGQPQVVAPAKWSGKAIASFVVSLVGIFFAAIICGTIGLVFSALAFQELKTKQNLRGKGLAVAGMVISIIDVVLMIIML